MDERTEETEESLGNEKERLREELTGVRATQAAPAPAPSLVSPPIIEAEVWQEKGAVPVEEQQVFLLDNFVIFLLHIVS